MDASERRRRVSEEAAEWWLLLSRNDMSRAQREQFVDWLRESQVNVAEILRIAHVHGALESFQRWAQVDVDGVDRDSGVVEFPGAERSLPGESVARRQRISPWLMSLAASVAVLGVGAMWLLGANLRDETIETTRGERREVTLADGSVLQVGPQTRLHVRFAEGERRIVLDRGATLFRVAKDAARPFLVEAERTVVRAVGTAFGVERRDGKRIVVTVSEGTVAVNEIPRWAPPFVGKTPPKLPGVALTAGQQIAVPRAGEAGEVGVVRHVDSERALAWAAGRLVFENESVAHAIEEFNRYNRIQMSVTDEALARRPISAVFDASDPESFIAFIESVAAVRIVRSDTRSITIAAAQDDATENSQ